MEQEHEQEQEKEPESIQVRCQCGWRLFDMDPRTQGIITAKCPRCKARMAVIMKYHKYLCTEQIAAHGRK